MNRSRQGIVAPAVGVEGENRLAALVNQVKRGAALRVHGEQTRVRQHSNDRFVQPSADNRHGVARRHNGVLRHRFRHRDKLHIARARDGNRVAAEVGQANRADRLPVLHDGKIAREFPGFIRSRACGIHAQKIHLQHRQLRCRSRGEQHQQHSQREQE